MERHKGILLLSVCLGLWMLPLGRVGAGTGDPVWTPDKYHTFDEATALIRRLEKEYPSLVRLSTAGKSTQDRPLWVLEITSIRTGPSDQKTALWIGGGLEGDEVVGVEAAMAAAEYLCRNTGSDARIRDLLDRTVVYIMPFLNPDAADQTVRNPGMPLSATVRPADSDRDGRIDEDPAEDLDNDGIVAWMRWKDPNGKYRLCPDDSRILLPVRLDKGDVPEYRLEREGLDNDRDGSVNEDGLGGIDLDRNFPAGWKMESEAAGSGLYPGSEPESESVMRFLVEHPNVALAVALRSGEPVHTRPFGFRPDKDIPAVDLGVYEKIGKMLQDKTGISLVHEFPESPKPSDPEKPWAKGASGTLIDWIYRDFGAYAISPTLWTLPESYRNPSDSAKTSECIDSGWIRFFEAEHVDRGFVPWKPFSHPQFKNIEIGGLSVFDTKNPPAGKWLDKTCRLFCTWIVELADLLPRTSIKEIVVYPLALAQGAADVVAEEGGKERIRIARESARTSQDALLAVVAVIVENQGPLGTRSALGQRTRYAQQPLRSVLVTLDASEGNVEILSSPKVLRLGPIEGNLTRDLVLRERGTVKRETAVEAPRRGDEEIGFSKDIENQPPDVKTGTWLIRMKGASASCTIHVDADKGGTIRKTFVISR